ncbi:MAG: hypothetical protein JRH17_22765 [Deltaproteobacteria bacterium]|nr:hypothetical protein [Deltaproteobacteria bacterium]
MTYSVPLIVVGIVFLGVGTAIGVRLLLLARRTREAPELLMGLAFLVGGCVGYVLEVLAQDGATLPADWAQPAWLLGRLGTPLLGVPEQVAFEAESLARFAAPIWSGYEAFRFHGLMQKRLHLGLADPLVTNRFLLWGIAQVAALTGLSMRVLDAHGVLTEIAAVMMPAAGLGAAIAYWVTFFPPEAYRRRFAAALGEAQSSHT